MDRQRILLSCPDRAGIIASVAGHLAANGNNILDADSHASDGRFFVRLEFEGPPLDGDGFASALTAFDPEFRLVDCDARPRVAVMVSKPPHCLRELLWRFAADDFGADLTQVVANHPDHEEEVSRFGVPYRRVPVTPESRSQAEAQILDYLAGRVDLVVLARYMQILTPEFLARVGCPVINIHHAFLPAFPGADPYVQAHERGVKLIGATAHYVTEDLDAGPIIDQDVARVSHRDEVPDLVRIGEEIERRVLVRALHAHLGDRVIVAGGRTLVF
jgi:formyltetrahydrofolate deformylase